MRRFGPLPSLAFALLFVAPVPATGDDPPAKAGAVRQLRQPIKRPGGPAETTVSAPVTDDDALKLAGLQANEAGPLLDYLKQRTLSDGAQAKIGDVIKRFGADDFEERVRATEEVERFGPAAITPLKTAERDADPEVAYRAHIAIKRMEKVPHSRVAAAAVRCIVKLKPKDAAAVLLGFLPMADTDEVAEEIRTGLIALAVADGKPEPALVAALGDKMVVRRTAAYLALVEGGPAGERVRIKEALPLVTAAVRKETDTDAKFVGLWALLLTTREKEFVPDLLAMIPQLPRGRIWQLEEFLLQLAADTKPDAKFGKSEEQLTKTRDAWTGWWAKKGGDIDLVKFTFAPRITGYTDIIEYDGRGYGVYRVLTLGPDLKEKAKMSGAGADQLVFPTDVKKLPGGNYLVAEQNGNRITERDSTGKTLKTIDVQQPLSIDLLAGGGMIVVCRNQVVQLDKDAKQVWTYPRQLFDIMGGRRLPGGDVIFVTNTFQGPNCFRLHAETDKAGKWSVKESGKALTLGRIQQYQSPDATGEDKILVCEYNRVVEYDLKTGKDVWKYDAPYPSSCQRLPNGNTLMTLMNHQPHGKVIEVDTSGDVVWEFESKDGLRCARAHRR